MNSLVGGEDMKGGGGLDFALSDFEIKTSASNYLSLAQIFAQNASLSF